MRRTLGVGVLMLTLLILIATFAVRTPTLRAQFAQQPGSGSQPTGRNGYDIEIVTNASKMLADGRRIFRYDTFGDEEFWGDKLKLHQAIAGARNGGVGPGLSPMAALALGLKIDSDSLPPDLAAGLKAGTVNMDDPAVTLALLKLDAVVGLTGFFEASGGMRSLGVQCALCHSVVDNSLAPGVGKRLDGFANRDLDIGAIINLAPSVQAYSDLLGLDDASTRKIFAAWGPGKFDARLLLDGKAFRPDGKSGAALIMATFDLSEKNVQTTTGNYGGTLYMNAQFAALHMQGKGTFFDPRFADATLYPIAAKAGYNFKRVDEDLIINKLAPLQVYQMAIPSPKAPATLYDVAAADRGNRLFNTKARCSNCHVPPLYTQPGWNCHVPADIGIDDFQSNRSPNKRYVTPSLKGLWTHHKGGFYHDGRFASLLDVVNHYDNHFKLALADAEKADLVEFLKSL